MSISASAERLQASRRETEKILHLIANAMPTQGPPDRDDVLQAVAIVRRLWLFGYRITKRLPHHQEDLMRQFMKFFRDVKALGDVISSEVYQSDEAPPVGVAHMMLDGKEYSVTVAPTDLPAEKEEEGREE